MQHNATERAPRDLAPQQTRVVTALLTGSTVTAAAEAAGVDRTTVHRWLREDWSFQAAYNELKGDLRREVEARLDQIVHAAVETVAAAVDTGDVRAAIAVLKGTGVLSGSRPVIGPEDPEEAAQEANLAAREHASGRVQRQLLASLWESR